MHPDLWRVELHNPVDVWIVKPTGGHISAQQHACTTRLSTRGMSTTFWGGGPQHAAFANASCSFGLLATVSFSKRSQRGSAGCLLHLAMQGVD